MVGTPRRRLQGGERRPKTPASPALTEISAGLSPGATPTALPPMLLSSTCRTCTQQRATQADIHLHQRVHEQDEHHRPPHPHGEGHSRCHIAGLQHLAATDPPSDLQQAGRVHNAGPHDLQQQQLQVLTRPRTFRSRPAPHRPRSGDTLPKTPPTTRIGHCPSRAQIEPARPPLAAALRAFTAAPRSFFAPPHRASNSAEECRHRRGRGRRWQRQGGSGGEELAAPEFCP